jgi:hypothetical protein
MKRSILIVCALGFAILLGTLVSQAQNSPGKAAPNKSAPDKSASSQSAPDKQPAAVRKPPKVHEPPVYGTGEAAIEAALAQRVPCEFVETPLKDVIEYLRDALKIEIWLDEAGLKDAGTDPEVPVTCNLRGCRVANVLDVILDKQQLTWTIHDEILWITSPMKAESCDFQQTCVYEVGDLVVYKDEKGEAFDDYAPLMNTITNTVQQKSWLDNGGDGSIEGDSFGAAKVLVVTQSYRVQKKVAALLAQIRAVAGNESANRDRPRRDRPKPPQGSVGKRDLLMTLRAMGSKPTNSGNSSSPAPKKPDAPAPAPR